MQDSVDGLLAPDGGWGWMVVLGVALTNIFNQSLISVFGLLFSQQLHELGQSTTGVALVMNVNSIILNSSGFIIGPAIKTFSPRRVAIFGSLLTGVGLILSSQSRTLWQILISYGGIVGFGLGLLNPSTFMAVNSYFSRKRGQAVGLALAGTGIGQMLMPQIVHFLLDEFGYRGAILIVGALAFHGIVGASLFQPVEWHSHPPTACQEHEKLLATDPPLQKNRPAQSTSEKLKKSMDLSLLKDLSFLNISLGVAMAYTSSINFSMLFPYFLQFSAGLDRKDVAMCMSLLAAMDLASRLTLPTLTDRFRISCRMIFLVGAVLLIGVRATLAETSHRTSLLIISGLYGYIRAATVVNQNLCVSEHCTQEKLAGALGLVMIAKGISVISLGQLLGWVRDVTGSYRFSLHMQNVLLVIVVIFWLPEVIWKRLRR
ncbi:monocarboxylate transporter 12 isoform X2 [Phlebotomus argentipes]|uniref:monocarboxylate transporter 12 isoform X2 n=1 Tax=Phlebotomus argentipes TaxID=94469 RepID=UPI0028932E36|nr:monocarboxylate transporter 12 isoform X2 [Phlebotomus argentipes]